MADQKLPTLILHGISEGKESEFIQKIVARAEHEQVPVLAINFPYIERGGQPSEQLHEEVEAISQALDKLHQEHPGQIHIVAKSLGGIAASFYLDKKQDPRVGKLTILGAVLEDLKTSGLNNCQIDVIQGEHDRFGSAAKVKQTFESAGVPLHRLIEIKGGDHSYRDSAKNPSFQDQAIAQIEFQ